MLRSPAKTIRTMLVPCPQVSLSPPNATLSLGKCFHTYLPPDKPPKVASIRHFDDVVFKYQFATQQHLREQCALCMHRDAACQSTFTGAGCSGAAPLAARPALAVP